MVSWKQTFKAVTQPAFLYMVIMTLGAMMFGVSVETFIFFGLITGFFIAAKSYQEKIPVNMVFGGFLLLFTVSLAISHFAGVTLPFAAQPYQQAGLSGASDWGSLIGPIAIAGLVGAITGWIRGDMRGGLRGREDACSRARDHRCCRYDSCGDLGLHCDNEAVPIAKATDSVWDERNDMGYCHLRRWWRILLHNRDRNSIPRGGRRHANIWTVE